MREGTAIAVSDGSFMRNKPTGAAAWVIESRDRSQYFRGLSIVPGEDPIQSPYRSELVGLLAIMDKLLQLQQEYSIEGGRCLIACDGIAALNNIPEQREMGCNTRMKHGDIVSAMCRIRTSLVITLETKHVKGHSDDSKSFDSLTRLEKMNVSMDYYAKQMAMDVRKSNLYMSNFKNHPLGFQLPTLETVTVCGDMINTLYDKIAGNQLFEYWVHKGRIDQEWAKEVDWTALESATSKEYQGMRRFVAKWTTGMIAIGKQMERMKMRHKGDCPFCNERLEDTSHVLRCNSQIALELWEETEWNLIVALFKLDTYPPVIMILIRELDTLKFLENEPQQIDHLPIQFQRAIKMQRRIGWDKFLEGVITDHWSKAQDEYYHEKESLRQGDVWAYRVIRELWKFLFGIWQGRNAYLHETERAQELAGKDKLWLAVSNEMDIGLNRLPAADYSYMFRLKKDVLLAKSMEYLKDWLYIIRTARKLHRDPAFILDEFGSDTALRQWVEKEHVS